MSPATHAVVGAAIADTTRRIWLVIPLAFASHFLCDAIFHFEAYYPLSRILGTTYVGAFAATAAVMAVLLLPVMLLLNRGGRGLGWLYVYAAASCGVLAFDDWRVRAASTFLIAGLFLLTGREARQARWIIGALAAQLPDLVREGIEPLNRFHILTHYNGHRDLGQIIYVLIHGEPGLHTNVRFENPYYVAGYAVEVLIEVGIVVGLLYYLRQRPRSPE